MEALIEEMLGGRILLSEAVEEFEKIYIEKSLAQNEGHLRHTAEALGIHRNTLSNRLAQYDGSKSTKMAASKTRASSKKKKTKARAAVGPR